MSIYRARVVADSIGAVNPRLTSVAVTFPHLILPQVLTHRAFGRNTSSSRATPAKRLVGMVRKNPAMPIEWGKNRAGMQATEELSPFRQKMMRALWLGGMRVMTTAALTADKLGAHKQVTNRLIEPWSHVNMLITATDWDNFFALRLHEDAQPEIRELARVIHEAMSKSKPKLLKPGQWHLPYVETDIEDDGEQSYTLRLTHPDDEVQGTQLLDLNQAIRVSVARAARNSYFTHDGKIPTLEQDLSLYDRLVGAVPLHASPTEHQACPDVEVTPEATAPELKWLRWANPELHGNLTGWCQYRKLLPGENQQKTYQCAGAPVSA